MRGIVEILVSIKTHSDNPIFVEYLESIKDQYCRDLINDRELVKMLNRIDIIRQKDRNEVYFL